MTTVELAQDLLQRIIDKRRGTGTPG